MEITITYPIIITVVVVWISIQLLTFVFLIYLYSTGSLKRITLALYDGVVYTIADGIQSLSNRKSTRQLMDVLTRVSGRAVSATLGEEDVQIAIGYSIVVGMNMFLRQPDLDEHILLMSETVARTQPELARMSGEDFTKIVSSFFAGMLSPGSRHSNATTAGTSTIPPKPSSLATPSSTKRQQQQQSSTPTTPTQSISAFSPSKLHTPNQLEPDNNKSQGADPNKNASLSMPSFLSHSNSFQEKENMDNNTKMNENTKLTTTITKDSRDDNSDNSIEPQRKQSDESSFVDTLLHGIRKRK